MIKAFAYKGLKEFYETGSKKGIQPEHAPKLGRINESSKYWLGVLNSLKNRGVHDILILCSDGLTGLKEAIQAAFPNTEHQRCIVHMVRNTLKYVVNKDMKAFARDLKTIYAAPDEKTALKRLDEVTKKWEPLYPHAMNRCGIRSSLAMINGSMKGNLFYRKKFPKEYKRFIADG